MISLIVSGGLEGGFFIGNNVPKALAWVLDPTDTHFGMSRSILPATLTGVYGYGQASFGVNYYVLGGGGRHLRWRRRVQRPDRSRRAARAVCRQPAAALRRRSVRHPRPRRNSPRPSGRWRGAAKEQAIAVPDFTTRRALRGLTGVGLRALLQ